MLNKELDKLMNPTIALIVGFCLGVYLRNIINFNHNIMSKITIKNQTENG